jgi:hypothetical protein
MRKLFGGTDKEKRQDQSFNPFYDFSLMRAAVFRRFLKISKNDYYLRHVCLFAWNNFSLAGRIFMKYDI